MVIVVVIVMVLGIVMVMIMVLLSLWLCSLLCLVMFIVIVIVMVMFIVMVMIIVVVIIVVTLDSRRTNLGRDDRGTGISHAASGNGRILCGTWMSYCSAGISIQSPFPRKAAVENRIHIFKESLLEPYIVPLLGNITSISVY